jgi:hypothetical protein
MSCKWHCDGPKTNKKQTTNAATAAVRSRGSKREMARASNNSVNGVEVRGKGKGLADVPAQAGNGAPEVYCSRNSTQEKGPHPRSSRRSGRGGMAINMGSLGVYNAARQSADGAATAATDGSKCTPSTATSDPD